MDWYQRHVLGEDSALRPPADLVSSVSFRSPGDASHRADYHFETHTIHIGAAAMDHFRGLRDALPFVVAHELGHAVQRTAAVRALELGEARDAPFTAQMRSYLDASDRFNDSVELSENLRGIYGPECRSPAELRADHSVETYGLFLARRLRVAELAEPVLRGRERIEGYADDFASDVVGASYEPRVARGMLGAAAQLFDSSPAHPRCDASRDDDPRARADDDHRPLRLHPAAAHRAANILGDGGPTRCLSLGPRPFRQRRAPRRPMIEIPFRLRLTIEIAPRRRRPISVLLWTNSLCCAPSARVSPRVLRSSTATAPMAIALRPRCPARLACAVTAPCVPLLSMLVLRPRLAIRTTQAASPLAASSAERGCSVFLRSHAVSPLRAGAGTGAARLPVR